MLVLLLLAATAGCICCLGQGMEPSDWAAAGHQQRPYGGNQRSVPVSRW